MSEKNRIQEMVREISRLMRDFVDEHLALEQRYQVEQQLKRNLYQLNRTLQPLRVS